MRAWTTGLALATALLICGGCPYGTRSGLPAHIRTVEVPVFRNDTFYKGLESKLTRAVIRKFNDDPHLRVVNAGGDAVLYGEIVDVQKRVLRETSLDRPASVRLTVTVRYSFEDRVERRVLVKDRVVRNTYESAGAGLYDIDRGEVRATAELSALEEIANAVVRQTAGMW